jgi:hypothetical protein
MISRNFGGFCNAALINTPLQRGDEASTGTLNRFSGFQALFENR